MKDSGVPARDAHLILGHSTVTITQEIYQHDNMGNRREALEKVERIFMRSTGLVGVAVNYCRQGSDSLSQLLGLNLAGVAGLEPTTPGFGAVITSDEVDRLTEVKRYCDDRRRLWLLGLVAVDVAVKLDSP
jgi:hypothetical protein